AAWAAALAVLSPYREAALVAFVAAVIAGSSDTVSSEVGKAYGRRTWLVTSLRRVPPGTSGAVSSEGTAAGAAAALLLAAIAASRPSRPRRSRWRPGACSHEGVHPARAAVHADRARAWLLLRLGHRDRCRAGRALDVGRVDPCAHRRADGRCPQRREQRAQSDLRRRDRPREQAGAPIAVGPSLDPLRVDIHLDHLRDCACARLVRRAGRTPRVLLDRA